ncbi:MAG: hypothetical protein JWP57_728 [Spirosoma sp.]|nr:hypothetical protein [Spirosoma sp.]
MAPTQNTDDQQTRATDLLYKMLAATGYLLDGFSEINRLNLTSPIFTMSLKHQAQKFKAGLTAAEQKVLGYTDQNRTEAIDQLAESYHLVERLMNIHLQAGRKLTEEARLLLSNELEAVAKKYGITVD